jgi:hypothetical protein
MAAVLSLGDEKAVNTSKPFGGNEGAVGDGDDEGSVNTEKNSGNAEVVGNVNNATGGRIAIKVQVGLVVKRGGRLCRGKTGEGGQSEKSKRNKPLE